jgi:hypothetical protein
MQACCNTISVAMAEPAQTIHAEVKLAPTAAHQLCHSHIRRDFQCMLESMGDP